VFIYIITLYAVYILNRYYCSILFKLFTKHDYVQGSRVLYAGQLRVRRDPRLELAPGTANLRIRHVEPGDGGEYDCEVELDRGPPVSIRHRLEILAPPAIVSSQPPDGVTVKKGSRVSLECSATGNPKPREAGGGSLWSRVQ
jgi:hypothetical protein